MSRFPAFVAALALFAIPAAAGAQAVEVTPLAAPDAFTTAGRNTGLPPTLWQGASLATAQTVLPLLAHKPLSPAAAALARRVLATGAPGPKGAGADPALAAARADALIALGDPKAAAAILARAPGLDRSAELSRAAAESALLAGDDARACAAEEALTVGRDDVYWLRLRTYCQAIGGHADQAQLTFELAQAQAKDPVFARLMAAKLAGAGSPGAASLRNGLDYALSRSLGLDLAAAKPAPAVAAALAVADPAEPAWPSPPGDDDLSATVRALIAGQAPAAGVVDRLLDAAAHADAKARPRAEAVALLTAALVGVPGTEARSRIAALSVPDGKAPAGRNFALEAAAQEKQMGETALLALWTCADAGAAGPAVGDRARLVGALRAAGLEADARAFAVEGLLALK
ncbi:hypothetical protein DJ021_11755 [Phenylobacterium hankyongense]|uniref:Uncharacterized protein n=1 Tax=Phenylobacterium hankyongense TaxID=1813876 RepID=A0A328B1U4_9CAUL|nr:hypothetical protein [Phenylobacterium hankyongense]RAK60431.1 hypothetical protein DJ021_11755 [Phenylobacterium hankyongense]